LDAKIGKQSAVITAQTTPCLQVITLSPSQSFDWAFSASFPSKVKYLSTTRYLEGGASVEGYENFNLAMHTLDNVESVIHNSGHYCTNHTLLASNNAVAFAII
jgi:hypothetical protein